GLSRWTTSTTAASTPTCRPIGSRKPWPASAGSWRSCSRLPPRLQFVADLGQQGLGRRGGGRRRLRLGGLLAAQAVDRLDHQEDDEGDDQELDDGVEEGPVLDSHLPDRLGRRALG